MSAVATKPYYQRKFPRYRVYDFKALEIAIDCPFYGLDHVLNIGAGGCGFLGSALDERLNDRLKVGRKVRVTLRMCLSGTSGEGVEIQANILYALPIQMGGRVVFYYGLEFIPAHRRRVAEIVREIEELSQAGKIMID